MMFPTHLSYEHSELRKSCPDELVWRVFAFNMELSIVPEYQKR